MGATASSLNPFVIDASVASAWLLDDESDRFADDAYAALQVNRGLVPQHWHFEVRNALLMAERRDRIFADEVDLGLHRLDQMTTQWLDTDTAPDLNTTFVLAREHRLSFYDALYLELAIRRNMPLATLDNALGRASVSVGLPVLPQP